MSKGRDINISERLGLQAQDSHPPNFTGLGQALSLFPYLLLVSSMKN